MKPVRSGSAAAVGDIADAFSLGHTLDSVLRRCLHLFLEQSRADAATAFVAPHPGQAQDVMIQHGLQSRTRRSEETHPQAISFSALAHLVREKPVSVRSLTPDQYRPMLATSRHCLFFPLIYQDRLLGGIVLEFALPPNRRFLVLADTAMKLTYLLRRIQLSEWLLRMGHQGRLIGSSAALHRIDLLIERLSAVDCPILITGESGTGKELIAQAIYFNSLRRDQPFVAVNCGAFTADEVLASELFGHARGAFTGAVSKTKGKFVQADRGTLFLDEVSTMSPVMQTALLRALRTGEIQRVGDDRLRRHVDARIIAATNRPLEEMVECGDFRPDTYARLRVGEIEVPPLRERREDIPTLVSYFVHKYSRSDRVPVKPVTEEALQALMAHDWPHNVAGLESAIRVALIMSTDEIRPEDLPKEVRRFPVNREPKVGGVNGIHQAHLPDDLHAVGLRGFLAAREQQLIELSLSRHHGALRKTARYLKISPSTLTYKIHKYRIEQKSG